MNSGNETKVLVRSRKGRIMPSGLGHRSRPSAGQPEEVLCLLPTRLSAIEVLSPSSGMIAHAAR